MRYFVTFSYDGTRYHGWQIQPNGDSVQARLQGALSTLLRQEIGVTGAGRTDAGVHARMMVAHFDYDERISFLIKSYRILAPVNGLVVLEVFDIEILGHLAYVSLLYSYDERSVL